MFKMKILTQTDKHMQRKNAATEKKCNIWKLGCKFWNPKLKLLFWTEYFGIEYANPFDLSGQRGYSEKTNGWMILYAWISKEN